MRHCFFLATLITGISQVGAPVRAAEPEPAVAAPSAIERLQAAEQASRQLQRAVNLARNTAVQLNGGLGVYQPAPCMVEAKRFKECLLSRGADGFVFRFPGGPPGWVVEQTPATVETELRVSADGRSVIQTMYNGVPRSGAAPAAGSTGCPCVCPAPGGEPAR